MRQKPLRDQLRAALREAPMPTNKIAEAVGISAARLYAFISKGHLEPGALVKLQDWLTEQGFFKAYEYGSKDYVNYLRASLAGQWRFERRKIEDGEEVTTLKNGVRFRGSTADILAWLQGDEDNLPTDVLEELRRGINMRLAGEGQGESILSESEWLDREHQGYRRESSNDSDCMFEQSLETAGYIEYIRAEFRMDPCGIDAVTGFTEKHHCTPQDFSFWLEGKKDLTKESLNSLITELALRRGIQKKRAILSEDHWLLLHSIQNKELAKIQRDLLIEEVREVADYLSRTDIAPALKADHFSQNVSYWYEHRDRYAWILSQDVETENPVTSIPPKK